MKMKRTHGIGDAKSLYIHIEAIRKKKSNATVEQLVEHLRSSYPCYARHRLKPFTEHVQKIISTSSRINEARDDPNSNDDETPGTKKRRKIDLQEKRLQLTEAQYMKNRRSVANNSRASSSSLASTASSDNSFSSGESLDEEVSKSEDAIYREKFEPEFDLIKSTLRDNYVRKSNKLGKRREVKEALELEILENKGGKKLFLVNDEEKHVVGGGDGLRKINTNGKNSGKDDNESDGPMFKDLGGMSGVIEELKMEVIVPLYHP